MQPDRYFSEMQIQRLQWLMQRSQEAAEGTGPQLTPQEETERNALIKAELFASAEHVGALADALGK